MEAPAVLDFKSTSLYAIRVVLHTSDMAAILAALDQRMHDAAGFFEDEPVVIDASRLEQDIEWPRLVEALKAHGLPTIGVMAQGALLESAQAANLVQVALPAVPAKPAAAKTGDEATTAASPAKAAGQPAAPAEPAPAAPPAAEVVIDNLAQAASPASAKVPTMIVDRPLRSGQKVYARHADLIVLGIVSNGAEVIADGNIHVYGPLRGKAMAGARGDTDARIFTTRFEAELVAVAGVYRTLTAALPADIQGKPATIRLDGEKLLVESLAT